MRNAQKCNGSHSGGNEASGFVEKKIGKCLRSGSSSRHRSRELINHPRHNNPLKRPWNGWWFTFLFNSKRVLFRMPNKTPSFHLKVFCIRLGVSSNFMWCLLHLLGSVFLVLAGSHTMVAILLQCWTMDLQKKLHYVVASVRYSRFGPISDSFDLKV